MKIKWTETVLARDYIEFLNVLWERVRPDLLFEPLTWTAETVPETFTADAPRHRRPKSRPQGSGSRRPRSRSNNRGRSAADSGSLPAAAGGRGSADTRAAQSDGGHAAQLNGGRASVGGLAR